MGIDSHLSTCVGTQSPKYLEMAQGHISLSERANGIIMTGIMKLIFNQPRGKWPKELIKVVWSHNTTVSRSTGFTPFKLLFGDEAITPEEAKTGSIRTTVSTEDEADYHVAKDTIEGVRLQLWKILINIKPKQ
jgi:hypothetical protein